MTQSLLAVHSSRQGRHHGPYRPYFASSISSGSSCWIVLARWAVDYTLIFFKYLTSILVWWQQDTFDEPEGFYMAIYAGLGIFQALGLFLMGASAAFFGYNASKSLHYGASRKVLLAPMSYFDTTPLGRIISRFAKDVDTIDNTLNDSFRMALSTFGQVGGAVVIVAIVNQWFLIPLAVIAVFYARALKYYRSGARQVKQLDNLLRSALYAHFSESLSGITTIRACKFSR